MRVIRLHKPFDLRMHDEPVPQPKAGEVLVRIKSVGICASDVHYYREGRIATSVVEQPLILGHEPSGVIEELGQGVTGLRAGARVAVEPAKPCWECDLCRAGYTNVCKDVEFFGAPPVDGALREFVAWPARLVVPIPDGVTFDEAAMVEPMAIGVHTVNLANMKGGESVAVLGAGAIGLSVLQAARLKKPSIIVVSEPVAERRQAALKLGADAVVDTCCADSAEQMLAANEDGEFDVVFECAGEPEAVWQAPELTRPLGTVVIVGIPVVDEYAFPGGVCRRKELTIQIVRRSRNTAEEAIRLIEQKLVDVASYVTHIFPVEKTKEALELAAGKADGVIRATIHII